MGVSQTGLRTPENHSHRGCPCGCSEIATDALITLPEDLAEKACNIAIAVLARKLLIITLHLLTFQEFSDAKKNPKRKRRLPAAPSQAQQYTTQKMIEILVDAGYAVGKLEGTG